MERNRDLQGRLRIPWIRRALLGLLAVVCILGLLDVFGQRPSESRAAAAEAELEVQAPDAIRGGLLYQARFTVRALQELKDAQLVLSPGWADGITINTVEPSPVGEASRDGRLAFDLGTSGRPESRPVHGLPGQPDDGQSPDAGGGARRRRPAAADRPPRLHDLSLMDIVVRSAITFLIIFFLTRIVGKRELSTFEPFDVILLVVMGDLVAQGVMASDYSMTGSSSRQ